MELHPVREATWIGVGEKILDIVGDEKLRRNEEHGLKDHLWIDPAKDVDPVTGDPPCLDTMAAGVRALGQVSGGSHR